ncbi:hypothetical protein EFY87_03405 [Flexivirga caeni]|uniref:Uncharacterized protein n=1 Tax=Flexivirga caeni TaxID=2294115 RepID=A0A3M9MGY1_9MICO|nr:hypothetical protein EFY87_03405 [Flexivirga caeni]
MLRKLESPLGFPWRFCSTNAGKVVAHGLQLLATQFNNRSEGKKDTITGMCGSRNLGIFLCG